METHSRPITLTCNLAKVFEGFTRDRLVTQVSHLIDQRQFARAGHTTTDALVYLLQAVYEEWIQGTVMLGCILLATLKVFDMIDHSALIEELRKMHVHPVLVNWINAFLCNRTQAVRIESVISEWKAPSGGIPQGTKLKDILLTIVTNNLLRSWNLRISLLMIQQPLK